MFKKLKRKKVKDVISMEWWKSIKWLEIFILLLEKAFYNQTFLCMIYWGFEQRVLM